ncbi:WYL domain-containing protein [Pelagicoccus sp. SDUM812003]|uniref:helix-turn-helix transcriptional regulator n=1 Tax=Pelagicoccus sp. SDUM812003 TaxID=3041267 RepID=UPI0028101A38|nr:WYL domain-containing protein [Pelagicoccus sp. SDUM812003]MDQ8203331.1 WYL domain-containing protein [Pelagicoccus sp. SDUM812003]
MSSQEKIHSLKRPAIERMLRIHNELKSGSYPNCTSLAKEMEVSTKTISRDIDFMRDRMLLPLEYDSSLHGYYYTREVQSLPTIDISEGELLALSIARKSLDYYKGTPFEKPLANALNKLSASLPDTITANLSELSQSISFRQGRSSQVNEALLQAFTKATLERRTISFDYKKLGGSKTERRALNVYHLTNFLGKWYAIGWDQKRDAMRTFLLNRASSAALEGSTFTVPKTFSAEDYLGSSFGIYSPSGDHKVSILFKNPISEYISENTWHPSQRVDYRDDGSIMIHFELGSLVEVASWILSWGPNAEAMRPQELRDTLSKTACAIAELYRQ